MNTLRAIISMLTSPTVGSVLIRSHGKDSIDFSITETMRQDELERSDASKLMKKRSVIDAESSWGFGGRGVRPSWGYYYKEVTGIVYSIRDEASVLEEQKQDISRIIDHEELKNVPVFLMIMHESHTEDDLAEYKETYDRLTVALDIENLLADHPWKMQVIMNGSDEIQKEGMSWLAKQALSAYNVRQEEKKERQRLWDEGQKRLRDAHAHKTQAQEQQSTNKASRKGVSSWISS